MINSDRIRIVHVDLGINIGDEIKKETIVSTKMASNIRNLIHSKMTQQQKPKKQVVNLDDKFDMLFKIMQEESSIAQYNIASIFDVEPNKIGPIVTKFKTYLKRNQNADWFLDIKATSKGRIYSLKNLTQ